MELELACGRDFLSQASHQCQNRNETWAGLENVASNVKFLFESDYVSDLNRFCGPHNMYVSWGLSSDLSISHSKLMNKQTGE